MIDAWQKSVIMDPVQWRQNYQLTNNKSLKNGFFGIESFFDKRKKSSYLIQLKWRGDLQHVI